MKLPVVICLFLSILVGVVSTSCAQEYAPLIQENTKSITRINLDKFNEEEIGAAIESLVKDVWEYFEIESDPKLQAMGVTLMAGIVWMELKPIKESGVKNVYLVTNESKDGSQKTFVYAAFPSGYISVEELRAKYNAVPIALSFFERNGMICAPLPMKDETPCTSDLFEELCLASGKIVERPVFEEAFQSVDADESWASCVVLPSADGKFWRNLVQPVTTKLVNALNLKELDDRNAVQGKIDELIDRMQEKDVETPKRIKYSACSFDLTRRELRMAMGANSEEDANEWRRFVEAEEIGFVKDSVSAILDDLANRDGFEIIANLSREAFASCADLIEIDQSGSTVFFTLNEPFFLANRTALLKAYRNLVKIGELASQRSEIKLNNLALAFHKYHEANGSFPAAYDKRGKTISETGALTRYLNQVRRIVPGCAILISDNGVFTNIPDQKHSLSETTIDSRNPLFLVELADPLDERAYITVEEFYRQLQNCPEKKRGYYGAMVDGDISMIDKSISLKELKTITATTLKKPDESSNEPSLSQEQSHAVVERSTERQEPNASLKLRALAQACHERLAEICTLPCAYESDGTTWKESKTLATYLTKDAEIRGCAMLVDDEGIFLPEPGKSLTLAEISDGLANTIMFVELADPTDERACVTFDEFYEQLQNCPLDKSGYLVAMGDGRVETLSKRISLARLKSTTTRAGNDNMTAFTPVSNLQTTEEADANDRIVVNKLQNLFLATFDYTDCYWRYPPAYNSEGEVWRDSEAFCKFLPNEKPISGCAMLVDDEGIFTTEPGRSTALYEANSGTIMFVELPDPTDDRACITFDELYEQFQSCPEEKRGYHVVFGDGMITTLPKYISRDNLRALTTKSGSDMYNVSLYLYDNITIRPDQRTTKIQEWSESERAIRSVLRKLAYHAVPKTYSSEKVFPAAYMTDGRVWMNAVRLNNSESNYTPNHKISGCAMLVDDAGIFVRTPGRRTKIEEVVDGLGNTIIFVELSDPNETRACITVDEFYKQLQNCPEERDGYLVVMGDGSARLLDKRTTFEHLKALATKAGGESLKAYARKGTANASERR